MLRVLIFLVSLGTRAIRAMCRRRADLVIENLALRQQVAALKKKQPRPPLEDADRAFWVALRQSWPGWASRLVIVNADTVARWNRDQFRRYWAKISRRRYPGTTSSGWRDSPAHPDHGSGWLGRTAYPRGAHEARIHRVRDDGVAILAAAPSRARPSEAMDSVLAQPQGRHCCDGSVHGADGVASAAVRLLRHRARPSAYRSLQRHVPSDVRLGDAATA